MNIGPDSDLVASITPDVMKCFLRSQFFGNLYGVTAAGGPALNIYTNGYGTVYEFTP